ncbi:MAG: hypothetical protein GY791_16180 [Alphaproteobacteria bacterium]|nr:hypothetical protein [Alphaproteobacteria bacterium]
MRYLIVAVLLVSLAACAGSEDFEYEQPDGMKPGPGLFTGEDGVVSFTIPYD